MFKLIRGTEVFSMATTLLILLVVLLTITSIPWLEKNIHTDLHHTDLMAGAE
ncbi:MAG: hypothetical protein FD164_2395 [Nitrospirae bacterium]|nr:MAG: hypothetical protein FD164_2395 [Nitrospirota bacterium]